MTEEQTEAIQEINEPEETDVEEKIEEVVIPETNKPKKISKKQQRLNAIEDFKNNKENNDYKVYPLKNGGFRVVKRETAPVESAPVVNNPVVNHQYTNDQYFINHIIELEKKYEKLRLKQKKLKKSHKKLKSDVYDDSEPIDLDTVSHEVEVKNVENVNETAVEEPKIAAQPVRYNKGRKMSWRQMLNQ